MDPLRGRKKWRNYCDCLDFPWWPAQAGIDAQRRWTLPDTPLEGRVAT